ncbi:XPC-binding domain, partial [Rhizoctonia solani]
MKIRLRTPEQKTFEVDVDPQDTILNLREKAGILAEYPVNLLKLLYAGRTLADDQKTIESLNLKENHWIFIQLLQTHEFVSAQANTSATSEPTASLPTLNAPEHPREGEIDSKSDEIQQIDTSPHGIKGSGYTGSFTARATTSQIVKDLVYMSSEQDELVQALKASFRDSERAAERAATGVRRGSFTSSDPFSGYDIPSGGFIIYRPRPTELPGHIRGTNAKDPNERFSPTKSELAFPSSDGHAELAEGAMPEELRAPTTVNTRPPSIGPEGGRLTVESLQSDSLVQLICDHAHMHPDIVQCLIEELIQSKPQVASLMMTLMMTDPERFTTIFGQDNHLGRIHDGADFTKEEKEVIKRLEADFPEENVISAYLFSYRSELQTLMYLAGGR